MTDSIGKEYSLDELNKLAQSKSTNSEDSSKYYYTAPKTGVRHIIGKNSKMMCLTLKFKYSLKGRENLLAHTFLNSNSNSNCSTYHRVVAYSEESHHFNVSRNR